jgi:hypothetical protein
MLFLEIKKPHVSANSGHNQVLSKNTLQEVYMMCATARSKKPHVSANSGHNQVLSKNMLQEVYTMFATS